MLTMTNGAYGFGQAPAGTDGNAASFSNAMTLDASGNLLLGKTSSNSDVVGVEAAQDGHVYVTVNNTLPLYINRQSGDEMLRFASNGATVGKISSVSSSRLKVSSNDVQGYFFLNNGTANASNKLWLNGSLLAWDDSDYDIGSSTTKFRDLFLSNSVKVITATNGTSIIDLGDTSDSDIGRIAYDNSVDAMYFKTNNSEAMRIDDSNNLLVGQSITTVPGAGNTTAGTSIRGTDGVFISRTTSDTSASALQVNKTTGLGAIINIASGGSTAGSIGVQTTTLGVNPYIAGSGGRGLSFDVDTTAIFPCSSTGARADGSADLGASTARFDDIYATNGTIQTSDRNEKQDIAELSDAEQRVAVAAKGLLRKFRWKDSVAEKDDEARTHFGIIAQDLQAAFAAEGLDASDYAMFISSTWTDEETNEEKTRMGVRYSELLAFIIAAI